MKKLALAGLMAVVGTAALASGYVEPMVEPEVVVAHSSSSVSALGGGAWSWSVIAAGSR